MHGQKILLSLPLLGTKIKVDITLFRNHALSRNKGEKGANFQFDLYEVMTRKGGKICCVGSARCSLCENVSKSGKTGFSSQKFLARYLDIFPGMDWTSSLQLKLM